MKCPGKTLQNLPFLPNECPGLCQQRPGHSLGKNIKLHEMKKTMWVFYT